MYDAFESAEIEQGLHLFNKPETDIKILDRSPQKIYLENGQTLKLFCHADSFPRPKFRFYKDGQLLSEENTFTIEQTR
mgnify:CR=1 FL=1